MEKKSSLSIYKISLAAVMAALVYVVTFFRFPLLNSKVHFANAMCLLSGMMLGAPLGGLAAGLGSGLYDLMSGGYGIVEALITFVSKFVMAFVCGAIVRSRGREAKPARLVVGSVVGAVSYVALYMLKTYVFQHFVYGNPYPATFAAMLSKLPASALNAAAAIIAAPIVYAALSKALAKTSLVEKLQ